MRVCLLSSCSSWICRFGIFGAKLPVAINKTQLKGKKDIPEKYNVNPLYTDTRYNEKNRCNGNLTRAKSLLKR